MRGGGTPAPGAAELKFTGIGHRAEESGAPVLDDALAWLDCRLWEAYPAGDHTIFVSGNDGDAKKQVVAWLGEWFGWKAGNVIDLGDITTARGAEMLLPLWVRLYGALQTPMFNFRVVR